MKMGLAFLEKPRGDPLELNRRLPYQVLGALALSVICLTSCTSSSSRLSVPIAGGQTLELQRQGAGFKNAENDLVMISNAGLEAVNLNQNYYVRWSFAIRPKKATVLSLIRIEDVTDPAPLLLVNDLAPQLDGGQWTEKGGLMELSSASARWLFQAKDTVRVFRFTISGPDGQNYVLYQGIQYSPTSKEAIRASVR
jgi:hypothetical protein